MYKLFLSLITSLAVICSVSVYADSSSGKLKEYKNQLAESLNSFKKVICQSAIEEASTTTSKLQNDYLLNKIDISSYQEKNNEIFQDCAMAVKNVYYHLNGTGLPFNPTAQMYKEYCKFQKKLKKIQEKTLKKLASLAKNQKTSYDITFNGEIHKYEDQTHSIIYPTYYPNYRHPVMISDYPKVSPPSVGFTTVRSLEHSSSKGNSFLKSFNLTGYMDSSQDNSEDKDLRKAVTTPPTIIISPDPEAYQPSSLSSVTIDSSVSSLDSKLWTATLKISNDFGGYHGNYKILVKKSDGEEHTFYVTFDSRITLNFNTKEETTKVTKKLKKLVLEALRNIKTDNKETIGKLKALFKAANPDTTSNFYEDLVALVNKHQSDLNYTTLTLHEKACDLMHAYDIRSNFLFDMDGKGLIGLYNMSRQLFHRKLVSTLVSNINKLEKLNQKAGNGFLMMFPDTNKLILAVPSYVNMLPPAESLSSFHVSGIFTKCHSGQTKGYAYIMGGGGDHELSEPVVNLYDSKGELLQSIDSSWFGSKSDLGLWKCRFKNLTPGVYKVQAVQDDKKTNMFNMLVITAE